MNRPLGVLLATIVAAVVGGCAAVPSVPVPEGSRIVVRLYDAKHDLELALANESYPELRDLYSQRRADGHLKLARDDLMGELLASLANAGMNLYAQNGGPAEGAGTFLTIDHDGLQRTFVEPSAASPLEQRQAFIHMKLLMDEYYKHVGQKQFVDNPQGGNIFRDQR